MKLGKSFITKYKIDVLIQELILTAFIFSMGIVIAKYYLIHNASQLIYMAGVGIWGVFIYFLAATVIIIIFLKIIKGRVFFQILFILALFVGLQITFSIFTSDIFAGLAAIFFIFIRYLYPFIWSQNLVMALALAGIAAIFGISFTPQIAAIILLVLAFYDIVAVLVTKDMVKLARGLAEKGVFLAVIIPENIFLWGERLDKVKAREKFVILGGGDLALPLVLISSSLIYGLSVSIFIALFSLLGIIASHFIFVSQRIRRPIPALPPIALTSIMGLIIALVFFI